MQTLVATLLLLTSAGQLLTVAEAASSARRSLRLSSVARARTGGFAFTYDNHGQDWHLGQCGSRERQSPIDFGILAPWLSPPASQFYYDYASLEGRLGLQNNGHSLSVVGLANEGYGGIVYNNEKFLITALNFHMQSEHTFRGAAYPMEVHLVHKSADGGAGLVIAVPFSLYQEPPRTYYYTGAGKCRKGKRVWLGRHVAQNLTACANKCSQEKWCHYFSFREGRVCMRYRGKVCRPDGNANFTSYEKGPATSYPYLLAGEGRCTWAKPYRRNKKGLKACKRACSKERKCKVFAYHPGKKRCWRYAKSLGDCGLKLRGQFKTFEKRPPGENDALMSLLGTEEQLPRKGSSSSHELPLPKDALSTFIAGGTFFEYEGSLTAPPCTEAVTWLVRREPQTMSKAQHDRIFASIMEATSDVGNWRSTMPLMGRPISVVAGVQGLAPAPPVAPAIPGAPIQVGLAAGNLAWDAVSWANQARAMANQVTGAMQAYPQPGEGPGAPGLYPGPAPGPAPWPALGLAPAPAPALGALSALSLRRPPVVAGGGSLGSGVRGGGTASMAPDAFAAELAEVEGAMRSTAERSLRFGGEALAAEAFN